MRVRDIMTADLEVVAPGAALDEAAYIMASAGVGCLPVMDEDRLVGVITRRDIVERAVAEGLHASRTLVRDIMTPMVISCGEDADASEAARLMAKHGVRRLVVLDERGEPSGVLSRDELSGTAR